MGFFKNKFVKSLLFSFLTTLALFTANTNITDADISNFIQSTNPVYHSETTNYVLNNSFLKSIITIQLNYKQIFSVLALFVFIALVVYFLHIGKWIKNIENTRRLKVISSTLSLFYGISYLLGRSFLGLSIGQSNSNGVVTFFLFILNLTGLYFLLYPSFKLFLYYLPQILLKIRENWKFSQKRLWLLTFVMLFISWLPYIIIFYPGSVNLDALNEIQQGFGFITMSSTHPILPTLFFSQFVKLGRSLGSDNLGLFFISSSQVLLAIIVLADSLVYFTKKLKNKLIYFITLFFFAFFPVWPLRFYLVEKDTLFILSCFVMIYSLFRMYDEKITKYNLFLYIVSTFIMCTFRNNGVYILVLSIPFMLFLLPKNIKKTILFSSIFVLCVFKLFNIYTVKQLHVQPGNFIETLPLPLQQTTAYVNKYELTNEEAKIIDKVVDINIMKQNYNLETIDNVKAFAKVTTLNQDVKDYLVVWFKMFFKHPLTYITATLNSTYGYFSPERSTYKDGVVYTEFGVTGFGNYKNFKFKQAKGTEFLRYFVERCLYLLSIVPIFSLLFGTGIYTWILVLLAGILLYNKRAKEFFLLIPMVVVLLVCIASPVNAYMRYIMPLVLSCPFYILWILWKFKEMQSNS